MNNIIIIFPDISISYKHGFKIWTMNKSERINFPCKLGSFHLKNAFHNLTWKNISWISFLVRTEKIRYQI